MSEIAITKEQLWNLEAEAHCVLAETATQCWSEGSELDDDQTVEITKWVVTDFHPELTPEQVDAVVDKILG